MLGRLSFCASISRNILVRSDMKNYNFYRIDEVMDDYEIKRKLWESKLPIEFVLDTEESVRRKQQSSFAMLPRMGYFPFYLSKIGQVISDFEDKDCENLWLEYNGSPLRWHYPIGLLYDLYGRELPLIITIKLKNFPDELVRCQSRRALRSCFIQSLKEADQLKHRGNVVYELTVDESGRLFDALANDNFDEFWSVNKKLMVHTEKQKILHVPIRFYEPSQPFRQVLVPPQKPNLLDKRSSPAFITADEEINTLLRDALAAAFPEHIAALGEESDASNVFEAISHGIALPLDAPVLWLARNFAYPDNFVHVVWRRRRDI